MKKFVYVILFSFITSMTLATESNMNITKVPTTKTESATVSTIKKYTSSNNIITTIDCDQQTACYVVMATTDSVLNALNSGASQKKISNLIENVVTPKFDFQLMTKYALGNNWKLATTSQQTELVATFQELLIITYSSALSKFKGAKITITNEAASTKKSAVLSQVILPNVAANSQPIQVEYDFAKVGDSQEWRAYDIKIENVSLVTTYRNQFNEIVQSSNIKGLITQLKTKVANLQKRNS